MWLLLTWPGDAAATVPRAANTSEDTRIPRVALVLTVPGEGSLRALLADPTVGVITYPNDLAVSIENVSSWVTCHQILQDRQATPLSIGVLGTCID
jgi:hypothetical protein